MCCVVIGSCRPFQRSSQMQHESKWDDYRSELSVALGDILKQLYARMSQVGQ